MASEDAETRQELAERLDWDDVPFHLAASAEEALEVVFGLPAGVRLLVLLDFERLPRATVMDALRARRDLSVQLLLLHDAQEDGLSDDKVQAIVQAARGSGEGGAFERESVIELPEAIPELREHRDDDQVTAE